VSQPGHEGPRQAALAAAAAATHADQQRRHRLACGHAATAAGRTSTARAHSASQARAVAAHVCRRTTSRRALAASVAASVGTVYGALSGYAGGRADGLMMRAVDIIYALPYMFLVIILVTIFPRSLVLVFIALGFVGWLTTARIVRGQVLSLKEREFVQAALSVGASSRQIVFRHLIPNTLGPIIVYFTLTVPSMILQEAFLSFLGLGVPAPRPSLGALISEGAQQMAVFWWQLVFPGIVMALLLFSLNFLGDGVRDALDPQMGDREG
jgi:oligopeptide transport system permease protein